MAGKRRYKTQKEYESDIRLMRKKAQKWKERKNSDSDVDMIAHLMFQNRWTRAKNNLRIVIKNPEWAGK